ncbi:MAG: hypothetical protein H6525_11370 [Actinobacteria bacterium]|nr:hypothetical protein [Actinomycetota bacterium]MCB9413422.1 hypothetical protein [Actinomycetota bacterium]
MAAPTPTPDQINSRVVLVEFPTYLEAQAAVDKLSDERFPVQHVSIIGVDLRSVESVLGRMSWGRAALGGLAMGAWFGLLIGLFVSLFANSEGRVWTLLVLGLLYGAAFGIIFGLVSYAFTGGKRDFVSRSQLVAARYQVTVDPEVLGQARSTLGLPPAGAEAAAQPSHSPPDSAE